MSVLVVSRRARVMSTVDWILPVVTLAAGIGVTAAEPRFATWTNLSNVLSQSIPWILLALAQMVPLVARGLDLSQGGVVVVTSVAVAILSTATPLVVAITAGLAIGAAAGALAGTLVWRFRISPLVATLGVGGTLQGIALVVSNGQPVSQTSSSFASLYYAGALGVTIPLLVTVLAAIGVHLFLTRMVWGRWVVAVGSNARAAALCAIPVGRVTASTYVVSGTLTALASILLSSRIATGHPTAGSDAALRSVAAAVIGGVSLFGGKGSVIGVLSGALFLGLLSNALNLLNVSSFYQQVAIGIAIIVAVVLDRIRSPNAEA